MKKILAAFSILAFFTLASLNAQAQDEPRPGKEKAEKMKAELGLSDDQAAQMKAIKMKYHPQIKAIKDNASLSDEDKKKQIKPLRAAKKEEIKGVLTDEQYKKFVANRKARRKKRKE